MSKGLDRKKERDSQAGVTRAEAALRAESSLLRSTIPQQPAIRDPGSPPHVSPL
jgi:hypothetical protein